jgi:hypothetical protein
LPHFPDRNDDANDDDGHADYRGPKPRSVGHGAEHYQGSWFEPGK